MSPESFPPAPDEASAIPQAFIALGWRAVLLLVPVSLLVIAALALGGQYAFQWDPPSTAAWSGMAFAVIIGAVALTAVLKAIDAQERWADKQLGDLEDVTPIEPPEPVAAPPTTNLPRLTVETTNRANDDYQKALKVVFATLVELGKVRDGERLKQKPFSFDRCHDEGLFDRWEDWNRVIKLLEASGVGTDLTKKSGWRMNVENVHGAETLLKAYYNNLGMLWTNGGWLKR